MGSSQISRREPYRIRVLIVDDHPLMRSALCDLLGYDSAVEVVGTAGDGNDALHAVQNLSPDVIVLDVSLPGMSGIEVAKRLCDDVPTLRIIMLTSYDPHYVEQVTDGCAHAYLSKSGAEDVIGETIRRVYRDAPQ